MFDEMKKKLYEDLQETLLEQLAEVEDVIAGLESPTGRYYRTNNSDTYYYISKEREDALLTMRFQPTPDGYLEGFNVPISKGFLEIWTVEITQAEFRNAYMDKIYNPNLAEMERIFGFE